MLFGHLRQSLSHLVHSVRDDAVAAERWVSGGVVRPAAHLISGIGQTVGGAERFAAHEVRSLASGVAGAEHAFVNGVEHGYRAISTEVKGVGQVLGSIGGRVAHDAEAVWGFGERVGRGVDSVARFVPIVLMGGALVWVARQ